MKTQSIQLGEKAYLNPQEAIRYWNLSNRKFRIFLEKGSYRFVALYGSRKLILREAFEQYLKTHPQIREELKNGEPNKKRLKA